MKRPTKAKATRAPYLVSEIGRYLYCARAWGYDRAALDAHSRDWRTRLTGLAWRVGLIFLGGAGVLYWVGWQVAIAAVGVGLILFVGGRIFWNRLRTTNTLIVYHGTQARRNRRRMVAPNFGLIGQPDYLLEMGSGGLVPILSKNNPAPDVPHDSHVMQVVAYCLLLAENDGRYPAYGIIRYGDGRTFEVDFDEDSVEVLSRVMDEMEEFRLDPNHIPNRSHDERARCFACRQRRNCDQSLF